MIYRIILLSGALIISIIVKAQEVTFFSEGTTSTYYDQGIVDVANLGGSLFEHTFPPGGPQWNDKVPCSTIAFKGTTSLKFNYTSSSSGNWKVSVFRSGWTTADISGMDSLSFYVYSGTEVPAIALPLIGIRTIKKGASSEISSGLYKLSDFNSSIPAGKWKRITFPLKTIMNDSQSTDLDFTLVKAVIFNQSENNNVTRLILIDEIQAFKSMAVIPAVTGLSAKGYDSHTELNWNRPMANLTYRIDASYDGGKSWETRTETSDAYYLDFIPVTARNSNIRYRVFSTAQGRESLPAEVTATIRDFSDDELLDMTEEYAFRYFWEGAHQTSGMALERTGGSSSTVASGATGMGLLAMIAAHERGYRPGEEVKERILKILTFLETCDRYHGAWSHWYNADTYKTQPFSQYDDGGDLVETSFVAQALIAIKNYFAGTDLKSVQIRDKADRLWKSIEWDWYRQNGQNVLYWHWSPNYGFQMNMKVTGWNECLVTYIMAASSPTYGIPPEVYHQGWAKSGNIVRKRSYYGYDINLSPDWGGPLFWIHYSHFGIDPHDLKDQYADYWKEHVNTVKIHQAYASANPYSFKNYSTKCWGLTASDDPYGYSAHQPNSNDNGTISPTAALASIIYAPAEVLQALKYFYRDRGKDLWGKFGPYDAFNDQLNWVKNAYLGIDQGPIAIMIENYRTGLLWKNVMQDADVKAGLRKLNFLFRDPLNSCKPMVRKSISVYPNPVYDKFTVVLSEIEHPAVLKLFAPDGRVVMKEFLRPFSPEATFGCTRLSNGLYFLSVTSDETQYNGYMMIRK